MFAANGSRAPALFWRVHVGSRLGVSIAVVVVCCCCCLLLLLLSCRCCSCHSSSLKWRTEHFCQGVLLNVCPLVLAGQPYERASSGHPSHEHPLLASQPLFLHADGRLALWRGCSSGHPKASGAQHLLCRGQGGAGPAGEFTFGRFWPVGGV